MQSRLDPTTRKLNGIVYTPAPVARALVSKLLKNKDKASIRILEPSSGDGAFVREIVKKGVFSKNVLALDIDAFAVEQLSLECQGVVVLEREFLEFAEAYPSKFDLVVGNPPYIRRHNFTAQLNLAVADLSVRSEVPIAHLKNAWAAFIVASSGLVSEKGTLAFVVPYELVNVNYGIRIQQFMVKNFQSVEIFIPDEKAFKEIDQDAVVVIARRQAPKKSRGLKIHRVKSLEKMTPIQSAYVAHANPKNVAIDLKSVLFDGETQELLHKLKKNLRSVRDYCDSSAGVVTAANDFFILDDHAVEDAKLKPWAVKILKKGSLLPEGLIYRNEDFDQLGEDEPRNLINFFKPGSPSLTEAAFEFIRRGEQLELNTRYKMGFRHPWYKIPIVPPSDGLFFKRSHSFPRLCINEAHVLVTDTAYQVSLRDGFSMKSLCFSFYNSLTLLFSEIEGRFYGGGVLELTPNEFKGLPLFYNEPTETEFTQLMKNFPKSRSRDTPDWSVSDEILRQRLQLSATEIRKLRDGLQVVKGHRLRHGRRE